MRWTLLLLTLVLVAGVGTAQPLDGNIVLALLRTQPSPYGVTVYFDPAMPTTLTTLATVVSPAHFHNAVRMAPNNKDVVVAEAGSTSNLINFDNGGVATTIIQNIPGYFHGIELDGDDTWVIAADPTLLWGVGHTSGKLYTFALSAPAPTFNEICIYREAGYQYAVGNFGLATVHPRIYAANRRAVTATIAGGSSAALIGLSGIELDPKTGDFITTDFSGPSSRYVGGFEVNRVDVNGKITSLVSFGVNGAKVTQRDTVWLAGFQAAQPQNIVGCMHFDLSTNTVITIVQLPNVPGGMPIAQIEIYGSHPLTCNGQGGPGATISVAINSQSPFAAGAAYQIALSSGRRPGVKMQNGEWLHLNVTDPLFFVTARNQAPWIFQKFTGFLDASGSARAQVKLPQNFPPNLGLTIFAAAVIFAQQNVVQVTNTHWFEL